MLNASLRPHPSRRFCLTSARIHAARKAAKGYTDGVVLARGETIPPGYDGFRVHAADCSKPGAPTSRDRQSDFLPDL